MTLSSGALAVAALLHLAPAEAPITGTTGQTVESSAPLDDGFAPAPATGETAAPIDELADGVTAPVTAPTEVIDRAWRARLGITLSLAEGNTSTRNYGLTADVRKEEILWFFNGDAFVLYGLTRTPSRVPNPEGATPQERAGVPGTEFQETANAWSLRTKYGRYFGHARVQYLFAAPAIESDFFRGFWWQRVVQAGYGRKIETDGFLMKAEIGPDFTEERQVTHFTRSRLSLAVNASAEYQLNSKVTLREELSHIRDIASNEVDLKPFHEYRTRSKTDVVVTLTDAFSLAIGVLTEHTSDPVPGAHPLDVKTTAALTYSLL